MNALEDPVTRGKYELVRSVGEECVADGELAMLLSKKPETFVLYDGFEPSGRMHIAQGVFKVRPAPRSDLLRFFDLPLSNSKSLHFQQVLSCLP